MESKHAVYQLPVASTDFIREARMAEPGPTIQFEYYSRGKRYRAGIRFSGTVATRTLAERACSVWEIQDAYDVLVEVQNSKWLREIRERISDPWRDAWELHHFLIYLDSRGSIEVIAHAWEQWTEEAGNEVE